MSPGADPSMETIMGTIMASSGKQGISLAPVDLRWEAREEKNSPAQTLSMTELN